MATEVTEGGQSNLDRMAHRPADPEAQFAPSFVDHDPGAGQPPGPQGMEWWWHGFAESFSDIERTMVEVVATPGHVVTVMDLSGTHTGEYLGHAPTGKRFTVRNVQVMSAADGKWTGRWGSTDQLGILQQLGLVD